MLSIAAVRFDYRVLIDKPIPSPSVCDVTLHPLHRIGSVEREAAGEHLLERHAERVEVAARIG